ncbi:LysR family transcriptional regulator [Vibrio orientalis CIP 102891 = ATCC 33934]|uniref:LysR-family transcriptional regulator n=1 Tax=Vibrio orientalis CIP 102891 = ATCC 33934 TaxID=675816 RepID=C9QJ32_VIBOR|nr:LysR family transcriptional regulator [Vibrio orientalis]EEX91580.1 LysR-family transcriptional regulator [Vibrio orientalis CIP 102891 = ATCC 33934]EGU47197.1 LysR family transcriptional regulator [Vibrio orientalis CIP 102891 = ATCC 33934]
MDKLTAAKVMLDVAQTESFTATADRLDMSRPMVTRYVEAAENWLGSRLLQRTTRKVSLTSAGEQLLPKLQSWVDEAHKLEESLMPTHAISGLVRVSVSMSFGFSQLMPALEKFRQQYPAVKLDIDAQDRAVDMVAERIDLAIRTTNDPNPTLIGRPFSVCYSKLVASPEYLATQPEIKTPQDLTHHQCLGYKNFGRHLWQLTHKGERQEVEVNCDITANEATVLLHGSLANMGISMQPDYLADQWIEQGKLVWVLPEWQLMSLQMYLLYPSRKHLSIPVRVLIDFLLDYFDYTSPKSS